MPALIEVTYYTVNRGILYGDKINYIYGKLINN